MSQLTQQGLKTRSLDEIIKEISGNFKATFGTAFDDSPESPDGQTIGIFAEQIYKAEQASQAVYQSSDADSSSGVPLEYVCDYNGVYRKKPESTTATVTFTGSAGATVPKGMIVATGDGVEFTVDSNSPISGEVSVTAVNTGAIVVSAGEIDQIKTPVPNVSGVTNKANAITGRGVESDAQLRNRRAFSVINQGVNTLESIYSAVLKEGADFVSIKTNDTNTTKDGIPPKAFTVVVLGLEDETIANAIYQNKPTGIQAFGTVNRVVEDSKGYSHDIGFTRPTSKNIDVQVTFKPLVGASNDIKDAIEKFIIEYISSVEIGKDVIWSDVFGAAIFGANSAGANASIKLCKIRTGSDAFDTIDIPVIYKDKPTIGTITITEVSV